MLRIGEFSKMCRVTIKALRHYDELGLLKPLMVDEATGYRYYDTNQLSLAQKIVSLKQIGLGLEDITLIITGDIGTDRIIEKLIRKQKELKDLVSANNHTLQLLEAYTAVLKKEKHMKYDVSIKTLPAVTVACIRKIIKNYGEFNSLYPRMGKLMREQHLQCIDPGYCFTLYYDREHKTEEIDVEVCESVVKTGVEKEGMKFRVIDEVPQAACVFHKGSYDTLGNAYAAIMQWIEHNGYTLDGLIREHYIDGIWNKENPDQWLTELQAPIRQK